MKKYFLVALGLLLSSCATYQFKVNDARNLIERRDLKGAIQKLEPLAMEEGGDQLVYLFDYGMALHIAGRYKESNQVLLKAEEMSEVKDYTSLSREGGSLLLNQGMVQYKGDDYEKTIVNGILALNFLMLNDYDAAMVETRKINNKLYRFKFEGKKDYQLSPFSNYLAAMIWEAERKFDDAYIDYKKTYELQPETPGLGEDLLRSSLLAQRMDAHRNWKKEFPDLKLDSKWKSKNHGEFIFIYQQGWGPRKRPDPNFPRVPALYPVSSSTGQARLDIESIAVQGGVNNHSEAYALETRQIYSVEDAAIKTLKSQYAGLVAKRIAGVATKAVVSDQLRQKNELLGNLAWIGMNLADRADLRQWSTLPESFQVARIFLPAGKYRFKASGLGYMGEASGESTGWIEFEIHQRKKTFHTWRSVD